MFRAGSQHLGHDALHITGLPPSFKWAEGFYDLYQEMPVDSIHHCAHCPLYSGPETDNLRASFLSLRPFAGFPFSSTALWVLTTLDSRQSKEENLAHLMKNLGIIGLTYTDTARLLQNPLLQSSFGAIFLDAVKAKSFWEITDVSPADLSVFLVSSVPSIVHGKFTFLVTGLPITHPSQSALCSPRSHPSRLVPPLLLWPGPCLPRAAPTCSTSR